MIEVYPHPALIELAAAERRLPYKAQNINKYWPELHPLERRLRLFEQWSVIVDLLDDKIAGVANALPPIRRDATRATVKACEDALDAVICAWVGICALEGAAVPFGDEDSSIWIPRRRM
jgi:predicted RNase H-like nuclease